MTLTMAGTMKCLCSLVVLLILVVQSLGAPRHRHTHNEKASARSYIDIDASDPFKVPKNSHYMENDIPENFEKEEPELKASVSEGEESPAPQEQGGDESEHESNGEQPPSEPQEEEGAGREGPDAKEGASKELPQEQPSQGQNGGGLNDLPPGITEKIDEIAKNQGNSDGKPIEINENDLKGMVNNAGGAPQAEGGPPAGEGAAEGEEN
ncbi:protein ENDO16-like [Clytia hemisphaerica]|uniref:Cnidarian restricted protein n=1 Tax=Clytia hemisphaerica TaxID=252671 RepID=A0A7M6DPA7_9CNID